jgi:hypothetical protein
MQVDGVTALAMSLGLRACEAAIWLVKARFEKFARRVSAAPSVEKLVVEQEDDRLTVTISRDRSEEGRRG